jgi:hypothetical protein
MVEGKAVKFVGEADGIKVHDFVETLNVLSLVSVLGNVEELRISVIQEFEQTVLNMRVDGFMGQVVKIDFCQGEYVFVVYNANSRLCVPYLRSEIRLCDSQEAL